MIVIIRNESIDLFNTRKKILVANEDVMDRKHFMQRENENGFLKNQEFIIEICIWILYERDCKNAQNN